MTEAEKELVALRLWKEDALEALAAHREQEERRIAMIGESDSTAGLEVSTYEAPEQIWWCDFGKYRHITTRKDEAEYALDRGAVVLVYTATDTMMPKTTAIPTLKEMRELLTPNVQIEGQAVTERERSPES
jgi:hypothetical protein